MGLNRMMMKNGVDLKNIKAVMTIGNTNDLYGFVDDSGLSSGSITPNPLPNGTKVRRVCVFLLVPFMQIVPTIPITINGKRYTNKQTAKELLTYLKDNVGKQIPVIFHFE